ncbi:MAG TPA: MBL fold metallo-hydrolase [Brevibacterium senegalense]|uniref:MBL fold metallo-hydrolase n=1 Tax=Brevibacterium senegalense TaxID=1033736 RepID=A0A921SPI0_9MICO|nr:MBL fold metallo-hydrolase [Brevibacterium senegalense]
MTDDAQRRALADDGVELVLADNPSPMTLDGTNSYLLRSQDGTSALLLDPGPMLTDHRDALVRALGSAQLATIVLTHRHADHSGLLETAGEWAPGVPVHAVDPTFAVGTDPLVDGQTISFGTDDRDAVRIVTTPGHTDDSVSVLHGDRLFSGDTVLGRGTTMVSFPDGSLGDYLDSLERLIALEAAGSIRTLAPAHGEQRDDVAEVLAHYRSHRQERIAQVQEVLASGKSTAEEVADVVYADVPASVRPAALSIVRAQLAYIESLGS